jgi:hypothetical protein
MIPAIIGRWKYVYAERARRPGSSEEEMVSRAASAWREK